LLFPSPRGSPGPQSGATLFSELVMDFFYALGHFVFESIRRLFPPLFFPGTALEGRHLLSFPSTLNWFILFPLNPPALRFEQVDPIRISPFDLAFSPLSLRNA